MNKGVRKKDDSLYNFSFYGLLKEGIIVYVGRTTNLKSRLYDHKHKNRDFDEYVIIKKIKCSVEKSMKIEDFLIKKHKPILNNATNEHGHIVSLMEYIKDNDIKEDFEVLEGYLNFFKVYPVFSDKYIYKNLKEKLEEKKHLLECYKRRFVNV